MSWARERFDARGIRVPDELVALAAAVDQALAVPQHACGFEFHHDGSGRVDFQILADSARTVFGPALCLPDWFGALLGRCTRGAPAPSTSESSLSFAAEHCLAFDRTGERVSLAGVWQHVVVPPEGRRADRMEAWIDQLAAFFAGTSIDADGLRASACLRHYASTLGMPDWIGVMSGRGPLMKIMATSKAPAGAYERFFDHPDLAAAIGDGLASDSGGFSRALAAADAELHSRIIVDVDLDADRFSRGFGIEVGPSIRRGSVLPGSVAGFFTGVMGVDPAAVERAGAVVACLPARHRITYTLGGLEDVLAPSLTEDLYTARLSHLKVVVRPDGPPALKTYVGLMFERGRSLERPPARL